MTTHDTPPHDSGNIHPSLRQEPGQEPPEPETGPKAPSTTRPHNGTSPPEAPPDSPPPPSDAERLARVALTRIAEPGDTLIGGWLATLPPRAVLDALTTPGAPALPDASPRRWAGLRARAQNIRPEDDLESITRAGGRFLCPGDPEWPRQLDDLGPARPIGLWVRGTPSLRTLALRSVALVGSRACTDYGAHCATHLAAGLAERGWSVVSGAAYGIDAAAHRGALAAGGPTLGVLACGVDVGYPSGHQELIRTMAERGLLLAELPPGAHPTRPRFILRNRVIAALTPGTVVVEAALRSGALVTARRALALGRHLMGVPGPITSGLSQGVHQLLRGEAVVITDADEVIEMVGMMGELAPQRRGPSVPRDALNAECSRVLEAMPGRASADPAGLARAAGVPTRLVLAHLHELQALGFVERDGAHWRLTRPGKAHSIE